MPKTWRTFIEKYRAEMTYHPFSQKHAMRREGVYDWATGKATIDLTSINSGSVDISEGICINLCRMWVYARNLPTAINEADRNTDTPEITFLERNLNTIMCAQALQDARKVHEDRRKEAYAVFGLSVDGYKIEKTLFARSNSDNYYEDMVKGVGCLTIMSGKFQGGGHAIGFDTREGKFHFFDPNTGLMMINSGAGTLAKELINYYFHALEYSPSGVYRYSRC